MAEIRLTDKNKEVSLSRIIYQGRESYNISSLDSSIDLTREQFYALLDLVESMRFYDSAELIMEEQEDER